MLSKIYEKNTHLIIMIFILVYIMHNYLFQNRIMNVDYLGNSEFTFSQLLLGRFMPLFLTKIIPSVLGVLITIFITMSVLMILSIFEIKKDYVAITIAIILGAFPSLAYSFAYMFYIERIGIALFCSIFSVYITLKFKSKISFLLGGLSLAISLGEYQSYIGVSICLALAYIIIRLIERQKLKEILNSFLKLLIMGITGTGVYLVVLRICLKVQNTKLVDYRGIGQLGNINFSEIPKQLIKSYSSFYSLKGIVILH